MDLQGLALFRQLEQKIHWLSARQSVLAENIANANTPGYRSRDLKPFSFAQHLELGEALPMQVTRVGHMGGGTGASPIPVTQRDRFAVETSPDGNQVSLEDQLAKVGETGMEYQMITNLYRKHVGMIKTAIGRGGNG